MSDLFKIVNNINSEKLILEDISDYNSFMINRALSYYPDTVLYSNQMNINNFLDKDIQYNYLFTSIPKRKRFSKWSKQEDTETLELIRRVYRVSNQKAIEILNILTIEQINIIKDRQYKGGV